MRRAPWSASVLVVNILTYIAMTVFLYVLFEQFNFTSPRGFPLKPFESYYAINDYVFTSSSEGRVVGDFVMRPSILFSYVAQTVNAFFPQGALSIMFSLIGLLYIVRLYFIFKECNLHPFAVWVFVPYLYYFSIFPSSDFLAAVFVSEIFLLLYRYFDKANTSKDVIKTLLQMSVFVVLASLSRPNALVFFAIPFVLFFLIWADERSSRLQKQKSLLMMATLSTLGILLLYYYSGVFMVYVSSSEEFFNSINLMNHSWSIMSKFFYSFGLRESFYTVAGEGFVKNEMYVYLRLALGVILLLSFITTLLMRKRNEAYCNATLVIYFLLFVSAVAGVSFERYFIAIYPFILQFGMHILRGFFSDLKP